ncbi:unnamed protein product [Didymodactylos carnosus]|uniref:Uncharacterized protein n=3 Tax=Didymodactylos carnosus TaxID=1234261 RepID=A0A8S2S668_9BILA|nr:unnamed protein product [Didymodactylos carnosus]CAF4200518.1 unnamed protein product [Didymodactylos carnosus]
MVKSGIENGIDYLILLLKQKKEELAIRSESKENEDENENALTSLSLQLYEQRYTNDDDHEQPFLFSLLKNIAQNMNQSKNHYRYNKDVERFALCGRNCYDFVRLNLFYALPSIITLDNIINKQNLKVTECEFRFRSLKDHLTAINSPFVFGSEDCTGVVP